MQEVTVEVHLPAPLMQYGLDADEIQRRVVEWLVISLFSEGQISSGQAATLLNIPRTEFIALLRERGVAYVNYSTEELAEEFEAAKRLKIAET